MAGKINPRLAAIAGVVLVALIGAVASGVHGAQLSWRLVDTPADHVHHAPTHDIYAPKLAVPAYDKSCARCHGADMKGNQALGVPNLADGIWLYDQGNVSDIERTILYGIRSGHAKSHNITDMPAVGRLGVLKDSEIRDVVEYVEDLSHQPHDAAAAELGQARF